MTGLMMLHLTATCPDVQTARDIAQAALQAGLAQSASIQPGQVGLSLQGDQIRESVGVALGFVTNTPQLSFLVALIQARHPDDHPAIRWHDIQTADQGRNWLADARAR